MNKPTPEPKKGEIYPVCNDCMKIGNWQCPHITPTSLDTLEANRLYWIIYDAGSGLMPATRRAKYAAYCGQVAAKLEATISQLLARREGEAQRKILEELYHTPGNTEAVWDELCDRLATLEAELRGESK